MSSKLCSITVPLGFRAAGGSFGIKASGRPDLALIVADGPCKVAAVFTTNRIPSEPVAIDKKHVAGGRGRAFVCNSGVANASTGATGRKNTLAMCQAVADRLKCKATDVLACSTGVIGQQLPMTNILRGIEALHRRLARGPKADADAAHAIMTTDLVPKAALREVQIGKATVQIGGIAKGSGMIAPNMATMLAFITSDVKIASPALRAALKQAVNADASFNRISVDSDTSPSDTVAVLASGLAKNATISSAKGANFKKFVEALTDLCRDLAYQIISDGEGITKVIRVIVERAKTDADALRVARAVADSPLVKTAIHGADPNWGRLTMAAGKSGAAVKPEKLTISIGPEPVYQNAQPVDADPTRLQYVMNEREITLRFDLGVGRARCEFLGCDLSREYIAINADYHT